MFNFLKIYNNFDKKIETKILKYSVFRLLKNFIIPS